MLMCTSNGAASDKTLRHVVMQHSRSIMIVIVPLFRLAVAVRIRAL